MRPSRPLWYAAPCSPGLALPSRLRSLRGSLPLSPAELLWCRVVRFPPPVSVALDLPGLARLYLCAFGVAFQTSSGDVALVASVPAALFRGALLSGPGAPFAVAFSAWLPAAIPRQTSLVPGYLLPSACRRGTRPSRLGAFFPFLTLVLLCGRTPQRPALFFPWFRAHHEPRCVGG